MQNIQEKIRCDYDEVKAAGQAIYQAEQVQAKPLFAPCALTR